MSIVKYANKSYTVIQDILNTDSYFNYSLCQNIDTKEYVLVEKVNKEKLRNELSKLVIVDLNKTYEEKVKSLKKQCIKELKILNSKLDNAQKNTREKKILPFLPCINYVKTISND